MICSSYNRMEYDLGRRQRICFGTRLDDLQCAFASMEGMLAGKA